MCKIVYGLLVIVMVVLVGCVMINVYFLEVVVQKVVDQFIGIVLDNVGKLVFKSDMLLLLFKFGLLVMLLDLLVLVVYVGDVLNICIQNVIIEVICQCMQLCFQGGLGDLFKSGVVGFMYDGMVVVCDVFKVLLSQCVQVNVIVVEENCDCVVLYCEVVSVNGYLEWEVQICVIFVKGWIECVLVGWYYQDVVGVWKCK